jgi:hypothetical protein
MILIKTEEFSFLKNVEKIKCLACGKESLFSKREKRKFCNRSCAASYNNNKRAIFKLVNCFDCDIQYKVLASNNNKHIYCDKCKIHNKKIRVPKKDNIKSKKDFFCKQCNKPYKKILNNLYCSKECKIQSTKKYDTTCKGCNIIFKSERKDAKFCTNSCKSKSLNLSTYAHSGSGRARSNIEIFVENNLKSDFPYINFEFNNKTLIDVELDIYIPDLRMAIELNGIVHYEPIYGEEKFIKIQNRDKQKMILCYEKGIELIVINLGLKGLTKSQQNEIYNQIKQIINSNKTRMVL